MGVYLWGGSISGGHCGALKGPPLTHPGGSPRDPPGTPLPGGSRGPPRGARGAHFGGYLITLPVGTEWDIFAGPHFWPKSGFLPPWDRIPPSNTKRSYLDPQNDPLRGVPRGVPGGPPARGGSPPGARIFRAPRGPPGGAPGGPREGPFGGSPDTPQIGPPGPPIKGGYRGVFIGYSDRGSSYILRVHQPFRFQAPTTSLTLSPVHRR